MWLGCFFPILTALVTEGSTPRCSLNSDVASLISSAFLADGSSSSDSTILWAMMFSYLFSFSFCSAKTQAYTDMGKCLTLSLFEVYQHMVLKSHAADCHPPRFWWMTERVRSVNCARSFLVWVQWYCPALTVS